MKNNTIWQEIEMHYRRLGFTAAANSIREHGEIVATWRKAPNALLDLLRNSS